MSKRLLSLGVVAIAFSIVILGCQTTKLSTEGNTIQTEQTGLAPGGDKQHATIDFALVFTNTDKIKSWKVEVMGAGGPQKQVIGDAKSMPSTLSWDGRGDAGSLAPEGNYTARLTVDYGAGNMAVVESSGFVLDLSPPTGSVTFNPGRFTPDNSGAVQPTTVSIKGSSATAKMDSWSVEILDKDGKSFRSFDGKWPLTEIQWDGKSNSGNWVAPTQSYSAQATLRDEFGNSSQVSSMISVSDLPMGTPAQPGEATGTFAVRPQSAGFSPNGDKTMDTMTLALAYGQRDSVSLWKLEILDSSGQVQKTFSGNGSKLPKTVSWDGKNDSGSLAPEGQYTARLSIDYGGAFKPGSATSSPFVLDITPPTGSITLSEALYSPIEGSPTITISVSATSPLAKIDSWRMEINDPENHLFRTFDAKWPTSKAVWDGKGLKGRFVLSAEDYPVNVRVRDEFGNVGLLKSVVPVDILVEKTLTGLRILSSRIFFKAYTADYRDVRPDLAAQNMKRLDDMATKLKKFPAYKIKLVGHAVMIHWNDKRLGEIEQKDVLLPLSKARSEAIMKALVNRGLDATTFATEGVGASDQLVPDSDLSDRWQNRRVAFFLEK